MTDQVQTEIAMMIHEVNAIKESVNQNLDAILARLQRLQPEEKPDLRIPAGQKARRKFYRKYLSE